MPVFLPNSLGSYVIHGAPFSILRSLKNEVLPCSISILMLRGCLCDNLKPSFLTLLIINWRTFSRRVTARWWRQWAKNQVLTNHNSRNRCCQILRRTIWIVRTFMVLEGLLIVRAIIFCFVLYIFLLQIFIQQVCPLTFPVASLYVWYVRCISFMNINKIKRKMKKTMQKLKMIPEVLHGIMISSVDSIQLCPLYMVWIGYKP